MRYMTSTEIRNTWLDFFKSKGHTVIESASLIPEDDDSLFFVNAGVTPLKKYFDGTVVPDNKRLTSIQKCIRTNDIENVGVTKRHQTMFEMMGNFSVGDYFREEARRGRRMKDLYDTVQQCENIIPRLFLLICVASASAKPRTVTFESETPCVP